MRGQLLRGFKSHRYRSEGEGPDPHKDRGLRHVRGRDDRRRSAGSAPAPATEERRARRDGRAAGPGWPAGVYWAFRLLRERTKRTSSQIATITSARKTTNSTISTMPSFLKKLPFFFAFFFHFDTLDLDTVVK